jgi:retron-type reverse transcriptase
VRAEQTDGRQPMRTWSSVGWTATEAVVGRIQDRIFRAAKAGDGARVKNLQKLLVRSRSAKLLAIRQVTQRNTGRNTPGIDGVVCRTPEDRVTLLESGLDLTGYKPKPVRRVYIPKANGKLRPLGIPTVKDRVMQAVVKLALEPEWETRFEANSYGFRPGRCTMDAIEAVFIARGQKGSSRWILDADISGCFDAIAHGPLLARLPTFTRTIERWLKAGSIDMGAWRASEAGTPQGGILSPVLANVALDGMERLFGGEDRDGNPVKAATKKGMDKSVVLIRYADDGAPRRREEVRDVTSNSWQPCCTRDEGRPLGLGLQDQGPNHRKPRRSNGRGGERCGKRRDQSRQVCAGQTNASEPLLTCRKRRDVAKTRLQLLACDKARREPADWPSGDRHEDGVRPARGSCAERGNLSPRCEGRPPRGRPPRSRVPMRGAGADGFVVPSKPGNAGGGKGPDTPADETGQPAMGGAGV